MCSKRNINHFRTVKSKVALWYGGLFALASAVTYFSVYCTLQGSITRQVDAELLSFAKELEYHYTHGEASEEGEGKEEAEEATSPKGRMQALEREFKGEAYAEGVNKIYFALRGRDGAALASSDLSHWPEIPQLSKEPPPPADGAYRTVDMSPSHGRARILDRPFPDGNVLEIGRNLRREDGTLKAYTSTFLGVFAAMLALGSVAGWLLARKFMAGVERVGDTAVQVGRGDFSRRVPPGNEGEEIDNLALAFNDMLDKIQSLILDLKMVTDDIAHDLRTPLTRIRGMVEVTVEGKPSLQDYRDLAGETVEECDRLVEMINTMLEITQTDSGTSPLVTEQVDLVQTATLAHSLFTPLAEDKSISFTLETPPGSVVVAGDKTRLQRAIANLLDNAIKYTPEGGNVLLALTTGGGQARLTVKDDGAGISKDDQLRIFDRFHRCDSSRSLPGNGLGLSLVRAIVKAHGGSTTVSSVPGQGSAFTVSIPRAEQTPNSKRSKPQ